MTQFFTKLASGLTTLALVASFVPAAVFAEEGDVAAPEQLSEIITTNNEGASLGGPVTDGIPSTDTGTSSGDTDSSNVSNLFVAEEGTRELQAVSDGGAFDTFNNGSINGQGGWKVTGSFDQAIVDNATGPASFGLKAFRLSNAVTSDSFEDQVFAAPLATSVGEDAATTKAFTETVRDNHFEMSFDFVSAIPNFVQSGLAVTLSPDRGDGSRMSYIKLADTPTGVDVIFFDVQSTSTPANFVATTVATGLDRAVPHNVKLTFDAFDGPSDDVVKVYVDGNLVHTGTSWENYYRFDVEASAEQTPRIVKTVLFRVSGAAAPATSGKGFLFDHVNLTSSTVAAADATESTTIVRSGDLETETNRFTADANDSGKWFFYNDENDTINNLLGSFVTGPATPFLGTGSAQLTATGTQRVNLATYAFSGTHLADIKTLEYTTYNASAGNGAAATANRSAYLQFNVSFNGADTWQRRLTFVPANNTVGSIPQDSWKTWDAIQGGAARWTYSGPTWPVTGEPGTTPKTWNQILQTYPNAQIRTTDAYLGLRVGEPYANGYTENIDSFVFGTDSAVTTYNFEDAEVVESNNGGGRSGGGRRTVNTNSNANDNASVTGQVNSTTPGVGQVLGAETYNFSASLTLGSTGADVTALQAMLIASGHLVIGAPTGYFGEMTRAALAKWQAAHGVTPATGYFGPITMAAIAAMGTPAPVMTTEARAALIKDLLEKVLELQKQLDAMDEDAA